VLAIEGSQTNLKISSLCPLIELASSVMLDKAEVVNLDADAAVGNGVALASFRGPESLVTMDPCSSDGLSFKSLLLPSPQER